MLCQIHDNIDILWLRWQFLRFSSFLFINIKFKNLHLSLFFGGVPSQFWWVASWCSCNSASPHYKNLQAPLFPILLQHPCWTIVVTFLNSSFLSFVQCLACYCSPSVPSLIIAVSWFLQLHLVNLALISCCFYTQKCGQEYTLEWERLDSFISLVDAMSHYIVPEKYIT